MTTAYDLSQPVASLLRIGTAEAHERAENSQGAGWLTRGELDKPEYVRFLMMLYHIYDSLERALEQHSSHHALQPTYNPTLLSRSQNIAADISYILQLPTSSWQTHPIHVELMTAPPDPLSRYTSRLNTLAQSPDSIQTGRLLAHAYVRYLGDLSGGQFIRRKLAKVYGLEDGPGLTFYEFSKLGGGAGLSGMGDMKKIKEWYRDGMNAGVGDNQDLKVAILEEANIAFELNSALFTILRPPTDAIASSSPALPPLGEPLTPQNELDFSETSPKSRVVAEAVPQKAESTYHIASVLALIAAVSLSHFLLVVGGFTGEKGLGKLEAVQGWFKGAFSA